MSQALPWKRDPHRKAALACAGLIGVTIALAALGRHERPVPVIAPDAVLRSAELRFSDRPDGSVVAQDAASGAQIARFAPGEGGFVRVTMRSFAGERRQKGLSGEAPFTLARMEGGDLLLQDPLTGRTMLLNAFGPSNEGAFAALVEDRERRIR